MIRKILAGLDGSEGSRPAGQYAAHLAHRMGAAVEAVSVVDIRPLEGPMLRDFTAHLGLEPFETYSQSLQDSLQRRADAVLAQFRDDATDMGVPDDRVSTISEVGIISETICRRGESADLIVIGQHGENMGLAGGFMGSTSEQVVRRANRPVMVCPPAYQPVVRPLVLYDASPLADDALHLACDFASQTETRLAVLVVVDEDDLDAGRAEAARAKAEDYLDCCANLDHEIEVLEGDTEQTVIDHAVSDNHGMIVMGAFGHGRIHDLLIGSTTAYIIRNSPVPVLLTRR